KQESRKRKNWIPACAGMTVWKADKSFDVLRTSIEEATGTCYIERNNLCLAFYADCIIISLCVPQRSKPKWL
ncbi:hypothetical protein KA005_47670, partial [bacterium]|nr:hypothetical protein [bacterium]